MLVFPRFLCDGPFGERKYGHGDSVWPSLPEADKRANY